MPDVDLATAERYYADIPQRQTPYTLKGSTALDWGMQNRLARIITLDNVADIASLRPDLVVSKCRVLRRRRGRQRRDPIRQGAGTLEGG